LHGFINIIEILDLLFFLIGNRNRGKNESKTDESGLSYHFDMLAIFLGCTKNSVPEDYANAVSNLRIEIENIEKIPLQKTKVTINGTTCEGMLSFKKRSEYLKKNRQVWINIFENFDKIIDSKNGTEWYGNALFCAGYGAVKIANLESSVESTDAALSYISKFLELNNEYETDQWTRKQMGKIFWEKVSPHLLSAISEKKNLDQFFLIARAALWENKKKNTTMAIDDYKSVLKISSDSFWGQQALQQLALYNQP